MAKCRIILYLFFFVLLWLSSPEVALPFAQTQQEREEITLDGGEERPLRDVLQDAAKKTGYRILYRDGVIAGKKATFHWESDWEAPFREMIQTAGLGIRIDHQRKQIVLFRLDTHPSSPGEETLQDDGKREKKFLKGVVQDEQTGERLPFAGIMWNGKRRGLQANLDGQFHLNVPLGKDLTILTSYIGYKTDTLTISAEALPAINEIPVRLQPISYQGKEILFTRSVFQAHTHSAYQGLLKIGEFSPAGESSTIRMLQMLPSVSHGAALSDGLSVRGSPSDAHQILLDGTVIYNLSHFFGLVDSFSSDAIRASSFHYDITPARYQGPPGGTLHLVTRTGSLHRLKGNLGLSSSAINLGLEGPLKKERLSWLLSGRTSLLNTPILPGTAEMVAWGLDIDRKNSLGNQFSTFDETLVNPGDYRVRFYDLHSKLFHEVNPDRRWFISGYFGYNEAFQEAERFVMSGFGRDGRVFEEQTFESANTWGNYTLNMTHYQSLSPRMTLHARGGISHYYTWYLKEDFLYQRPGTGEVTRSQIFRVHPLEHESRLIHLNANADVHHAVSRSFLKNFGYGFSLNKYTSEYNEASLNRALFSYETDPFLMESYLEGVFRIGGGEAWRRERSWQEYLKPIAHVETGIRFQYFSDGGFLRASPRLHFLLFPNAPVSAGIGYSRSWQYLYKLAFYNVTSSDIWITASDQQPPSATGQLSSGIYFRPGERWLFQAEAYVKNQQNLRFHELNIQSVQQPITGAPWFSNMEGKSRGLEFMARYRTEYASFTQTYTLSSAELQNVRLNNGEWFYAYWDRRHQLNSIVEAHLLRKMRVQMNWLFASGVPDRLHLFDVGEGRLGMYGRLDLSLHYTMEKEPHRWVFQAGIYNVLNRKNPWYREWFLTLPDSAMPNRYIPQPADVYDLGFQPSFSIRYYFDS